MGRGSLYDVSEGNAKILEGKKKEERPITHHVGIKGGVQGLEQREVPHFSNIRHHRVGNRSEEVGGDSVIGDRTIGCTVGGLVFSREREQRG